MIDLPFFQCIELFSGNYEFKPQTLKRYGKVKKENLFSIQDDEGEDFFRIDITEKDYFVIHYYMPDEENEADYRIRVYTKKEFISQINELLTQVLRLTLWEE
jgi:hypothetical protein